MRSNSPIKPSLKTAVLMGGLLAISVLSGCQVTPVAAWEKGTLAEPVMSPSGLPQYSAINTHIYTSKETAKGGDGVAGGGCGCN